MHPSFTCLQPDELKKFIAGDMSPTRVDAIEGHLSTCEACRMSLDATVGDRAWWQDLESALRTDTHASEFDNPESKESVCKRLTALLGPTDDPTMLGRIGSYEVIGLLGYGGMGAVFKAHDPGLNRFVAIKILFPHLALSGAARARFRREGQAAAAIIDDCVLPIYAVDEWQGVPYLVMQYTQGVSLQKRLHDRGPLDVKEILRIGLQAARGLAAAHAQGLVHRDVKPSNILLDGTVDRALLTDFGLARAVDDASLTTSGIIAGTPQYMSPEQARAESVDHRSDLFSLGSVMYAMCTGQAPFRAESCYGVLRLIADKEPRPIREINPEIPEWLCKIINKLMAKQAKARFASAGEVANLLESCIAHLQQPTSNPLPRPCKSRLAKLTAIALFICTLIFAGVMIVLAMNSGGLTSPSETVQAGELPQVPQQSLGTAVMEFNNLHSSDAEGNSQPPLTQDEFLAILKWKLGNDELSDEMVKAIEPILYTRDRMLPAGWRFVGGQIKEIGQHGIVQTWQIKIETNGLSEPLVIRKSSIGFLAYETKVEPAKVPETMVSLNSLVDEFNAKRLKLESRTEQLHEISPLTTDEVLAALAWSDSADKRTAAASSGNKGVIEKWLPQILSTHYLPQSARIEFIPTIENAIGQRFYIQQIELQVPDSADSAKFDTAIVRKQFVGQALGPLATRWSKPGKNGLQVGMRFLPAANTYEHGEVIDIEFLYRSATRRKIPVTLPATFQFGKVEGIRLERISFVEPKWPDGAMHALIGNKPLAVRGHRMQICFKSDEALKPDVNLRALTRPDAHHYVRLTIENPGDDSQGEMLEIAERIDFSILPLTPHKVLPLYEAHYYKHWGTSVPNHRLPDESNPDPSYVDTFQIGVSLGPAEQQRIPAYYASGLQVTQVAPNSPAAAVGIEVGDIILTWEENQLHGDDPAKPFAHYSIPDKQLRNALELYRKSKGWSNFSIDLDLLDHRMGEVIRIQPTFGQTANGGPNKAEILKRMAERKRVRS